MTYARSILIPKGSAGTFHRVSGCVRRAFMCGEDQLTGRSFAHRRQWVEDRIHLLADIFGVALWGYADRHAGGGASIANDSFGVRASGCPRLLRALESVQGALTASDAKAALEAD